MDFVLNIVEVLCSLFWIYEYPFSLFFKLSIIPKYLVDYALINRNETFVKDIFFFLPDKYSYFQTNIIICIVLVMAVLLVMRIYLKTLVMQ